MGQPDAPATLSPFPNRNGRPGGNAPQPEQTSTDHLQALTLAIAQNRAVVYVGAGVSASAGLATWEQLLWKLKKLTEPFSKTWDETANKYFKGLFEKSKNLEAADWLQEVLDSELEQALWQEFGKRVIQDKLGPSAIHSNLARIPFSMAITTNYDTLLEIAFRGASSLTWLDQQAIVQALRDNRFVVLHSHGVIGNGPSLILTGTQYGDLMHGNPRFGELLRWILTTRTCLFVGTALDDPDLLFQLRQGVAEHGSAFGPHYALLPADEAPQLRQTIIKNNLRIHVIPVMRPEGSASKNTDEEKSAPQDNKTAAENWRTRPTARILRDLSGQVAQQKFELGLPQLPTSDDPLFYLYDALDQLLAQLCKLTGSFRGDICLVPQSSELQSKESSGRPKYVRSWGPTESNVSQQEVTASSICGIAFYKATSEFGVYLPDATKRRIPEDSKLDLFGEIDYKVGHTDVRSELAVPIEASGKRIGVLNLESQLVDGYAAGHQFVARKFAEKAGRLYTTTQEREARGSRIAGGQICRSYGRVHDLAVRLLALVDRAPRDHTIDAQAFSFLVYRANFISGSLVAQNPDESIFKIRPRNIPAPNPDAVIPQFRFPNESKGEQSGRESLAGIVFREGRPYVYSDAESVFKNKIVTYYRDQLEIKGALLGFPIVTHGHTGGVVIAWFRGGQDKLDGRHVGMLRRLAHLIVNVRQIREREFESASENEAELKPAPILNTAREIVTALGNRSEPPSTRKNDLNKFGEKVWSRLGTSVHEFLKVLSKQEADFMKAHRRADVPDTWVHPYRCRCWVRAKLPTHDAMEVPCFVLAFQTTTEACTGVNQLDYDDGDHKLKRLGVAMSPHPRPEAATQNGRRTESSGGSDPPPTDLAEASKVRQIQIALRGPDGDMPTPVHLFKNNPHLSFLLSRAKTRPFAFLQRPRVLGEDVMADILKKDKNSPWLVAPVLVAKQDDWRDGLNNCASEDRLVAFLTFDKPKDTPLAPDDPRSWGKAGQPATPESWLALQNDFLHELDLFAAGISQRKYFQDLLKLLKADQGRESKATVA